MPHDIDLRPVSDDDVTAVHRPRRADGTVTGSRVLRLAAVVAALLVLSACAASGNPEAGGPGSQPGFLYGLWHGVITPVTFIVSLFSDGVGIYEVDNNGGWYDFGYVLGLSIIFGGGVGGASRR